jgi:hypothetical protein
MKLMRAAHLVPVLLILALPAGAEIEKYAVPCEQRLCFYWWPKLPSIQGWEQDRGYSFHYRVNALVPKGSSFANANTVMYAKAVYKPREPEATSLSVLIENDRRDFIKDVPSVKIEEVEPLATGDGMKLRSLIFTPPASGGNWEQVSYGEEGDFYLIFTVSSRSAEGFAASRAVYGSLISHYKEKP